jgi:diguanylate cyclase (GGDEF)-like protein/PAS domain S-box-containing protein
MLSVNPAFCALSGSVEDELVGRSLLERLATAQDRQVVDAMWADLSRAGQWQGEIQNPHTDGRRMPEWLTVSAVYDAEGAVARYVAVFVDISAMKATEARLSHLAHHDPLTDLPNRALLYTQMRRSIDRAKQRGERVAILFLDLDKFKAVNDELGHASGDQLLQQVSARLRGAIRSQDTLARISGDEFVLILEAQANATETDAALVRILDCFASPYSLDGQPRSITASVGVSCFPLDGTDPDTLLRKADLAMYQVKQHGRDGYRLFHASA